MIVSGTLHSLSGTRFRIEFFVGFFKGDATTYLGFVEVTTSPNNASIATILPVTLAPGQFLIATATDLTTMDTSEFSGAIAVL